MTGNTKISRVGEELLPSFRISPFLDKITSKLAQTRILVRHFRPIRFDRVGLLYIRPHIRIGTTLGHFIHFVKLFTQRMRFRNASSDAHLKEGKGDSVLQKGIELTLARFQ